MSGRANSTNSTGTTQTQAGNVSTNAVWVTTFPRPSGQTITVTRLNGQMSAAGTTVGTVVERDSDGAFWDATNNVNVPPDYTTLQVGDDMKSA